MHNPPRLYLASGSKARAALLRNAGVAFTQGSVDFDESAAKRSAIQAGLPPSKIAGRLAFGKAISADAEEAQYILGADQVLTIEGELLSKVATHDDAARILATLQGRSHELISAASICRRGREIWSASAMVKLHMRALSEAEIKAYLDLAWPTVSDAVGCYHLEGLGVQLFERIEGDYFTVLGLPLLDILAFLRREGLTTI